MSIPPSIAARARERQVAALQAADKRARSAPGPARRSRTQIAAALSLGYDQYARYVNGDTPLRVEQIEQFAQVYGLEPDVLGRAILTGDVREVEGVPYSMAEDLRGYVPEAEIPSYVAEWAGYPEADQRAAVDVIKRQTQQRQREVNAQMAQRRRQQGA